MCEGAVSGHKFAQAHSFIRSGPPGPTTPALGMNLPTHMGFQRSLIILWKSFNYFVLSLAFEVFLYPNIDRALLPWVSSTCRIEIASHVAF